MKIYVLVDNDNGEPVFGGRPAPKSRKIRAYTTKGTAKYHAKRYGCYVVEIDLTDGEIV